MTQVARCWTGYQWCGVVLCALSTAAVADVERRADLAPDQIDIELQRPLLKADGSVVLAVGPHRARFRYHPDRDCATLAADDDADSSDRAVLGLSVEDASAAARSPRRDNAELVVRSLAVGDVCRAGDSNPESGSQAAGDSSLRLGEVRAVAIEADPALEAMLRSAGGWVEQGETAGVSASQAGSVVWSTGSGSVVGLILGAALIMAAGGDEAISVTTVTR